MFYNGVVYMCGILFRNILESLNMAIDQRLHCLITEIAFIKDPANDLRKKIWGGIPSERTVD